MPIPLTKYNRTNNITSYGGNNVTHANTRLHLDLSHNSYSYNQYILTCDLSDTQYLDNGTLKSNKIYLNNKADYLIHPFSVVSNCVTKFNNEKTLFQYKKPIVPEITGETDYDISATQKIIQNTVRVAGSLYTNNLGSLYTNSNNITTNKPWNNGSDRLVAHGKNENIANSSIKRNYGVDIKHNCYDRYLGRKKSQNLKSDKEGSTPIAMTSNNPPTYFGNKTYKFSIVNCSKTC